MLRRTTGRAAAVLLLAGLLAGCGAEEPTAKEPDPAAPASTSTSPASPASPTTPTEPTGSPDAPTQPRPTSGLMLNEGWSYDSCVPAAGPVLLQHPFEAVSPVRIEDIGVYPGGLPVRGAWVTRAGKGVPDLVHAMPWPDGFSAKDRATFGWADRTEAVEERLAVGRYHLFLLVDLEETAPIEDLDIAWTETEGSETGTLKLDYSVSVGTCE